jgi:hypothetical protein
MSGMVVALVLFGIAILGLAGIMAWLDEHDGFSEVGTNLDRSTILPTGKRT